MKRRGKLKGREEHRDDTVMAACCDLLCVLLLVFLPASC